MTRRLNVADLDGVAADKRGQALRRAGLIEQMQRRVADARKHGRSVAAAQELFARSSGVPARTLRRWARRLADEGLAGLVDARGGSGRAVISPGAWELFCSMWLDQRRPIG